MAEQRAGGGGWRKVIFVHIKLAKIRGLSTLPLGHIETVNHYERVDWEETFCFLWDRIQRVGNEQVTLALQAVALSTTQRQYS